MTSLSVIVPTYNSEETIERCLTSLLSQTYQDFEICIIDGNSIDRTLSIISHYQVLFKSIRVISEPDGGTYDAMNKGIDIAQGNWLYFLGSDDEIADKEVFSDIFSSSTGDGKNSNKSDVMYGNVKVIGDSSWARDQQIYDGAFNIDKLTVKNICHQAMFYRKELFKKFGKYNIEYRICADWEINLRFFSKADFTYVDRVVAYFHNGGISTRHCDLSIANDFEKIKKKALIEAKVRQLRKIFGFV